MIRMVRIMIVIWCVTFTCMAGAEGSLRIDNQTDESALPHMFFETSEDNATFETFLMNLDGFKEC